MSFSELLKIHERLNKLLPLQIFFPALGRVTDYAERRELIGRRFAANSIEY
jgi:hypothetical protein